MKKVRHNCKIMKIMTVLVLLREVKRSQNCLTYFWSGMSSDSFLKGLSVPQFCFVSIFEVSRAGTLRNDAGVPWSSTPQKQERSESQLKNSIEYEILLVKINGVGTKFSVLKCKLALAHWNDSLSPLWMIFLVNEFLFKSLLWRQMRKMSRNQTTNREKSGESKRKCEKS